MHTDELQAHCAEHRSPHHEVCPHCCGSGHFGSALMLGGHYERLMCHHCLGAGVVHRLDAKSLEPKVSAGDSGLSW